MRADTASRRKARRSPGIHRGIFVSRRPLQDRSGRPSRTFLFHKPYGVVSQFSPQGSRHTLKDFGPFPRDVYPVGRLDAESEGLMLLTNDPAIVRRWTDPRYKESKRYLVQVERIPEDDALERLRSGIRLDGMTTRPAEVRLLESPPPFPDRAVPIRFRKNVPTAWLEITIREGRNRQIRRMSASVGHPTLRLIRVGIGSLELGSLRPGESRELTEKESNLLKPAGRGL